LRLSLSPDGKSLLYPTMQTRNSLWLVDNIPQPSFWGRFQDLLFRR